MSIMQYYASMGTLELGNIVFRISSAIRKSLPVYFYTVIDPLPRVRIMRHHMRYSMKTLAFGNRIWTTILYNAEYYTSRLIHVYTEQQLMEIYGLVLLSWRLPLSINFIAGRMEAVMQLILMLLFIFWYYLHIYRSGGALSFSSGTSLPGRRSAGSDMYLIRDSSRMGIHCFTWEYNTHNSACFISWY